MIIMMMMMTMIRLLMIMMMLSTISNWKEAFGLLWEDTKTFEQRKGLAIPSTHIPQATVIWIHLNPSEQSGLAIKPTHIQHGKCCRSTPFAVWLFLATSSGEDLAICLRMISCGRWSNLFDHSQPASDQLLLIQNLNGINQSASPTIWSSPPSDENTPTLIWVFPAKSAAVKRRRFCAPSTGAESGDRRSLGFSGSFWQKSQSASQIQICIRFRVQILLCIRFRVEFCSSIWIRTLNWSGEKCSGFYNPWSANKHQLLVISLNDTPARALWKSQFSYRSLFGWIGRRWSMDGMVYRHGAARGVVLCCIRVGKVVGFGVNHFFRAANLQHTFL